jgi:uncharacterized protein YndB with AHSA1/START domain
MHRTPPPAHAPAPVPDRITRAILIDASPDRVWAALTEGRHLGRWFGDAGAEVELRPGGRLVVRWREHGTALGVVERVEPPRVFAFRWSLLPDEDPRPGIETRVTFSLSGAPEGGTLLEVEETGFASLEGGVEEQKRHLKANEGGWRAELEELRLWIAGSGEGA